MDISAVLWSWSDCQVTDSVSVPYERYQRKLIPPESIELTIDKNGNDIILTSP